MVSTQPARLPLLAWRLCCLLWRCSPATFRRGERCASIRWWHCATNDGCAVLQLDWLRADDEQTFHNPVRSGLPTSPEPSSARQIMCLHCRRNSLPCYLKESRREIIAGIASGGGSRMARCVLHLSAEFLSS